MKAWLSKRELKLLQAIDGDDDCSVRRRTLGRNGEDVLVHILTDEELRAIKKDSFTVGWMEALKPDVSPQYKVENDWSFGETLREFLERDDEATVEGD